MAVQDRTFIWNQGLWKKNNVVYHRTNKCAGTYLSNLLSANGWEEIDHFGIKDNDINFGFLLDPYVRRVKSITEKIFMSGQQSRINDVNFCKLFEDICIIDEHMIPYSIQFKNIKRLTLFPILPNFSVFDITLNFLKKHKIELKFIDNIDCNISDPYKIKVYEHIRSTLKFKVFEHVFQDDILLYDRILKDFLNKVND